MNSEDYVSYPIALALKKHGFDELCDHCYAKTDESKHEFVRMTVSRDYNKPRDGEPPFLTPICSAVPLWQAQKWLRDKKGVLLWVYPDSQPIDEEYSEIELTGEWWWEIDGSVSEGSGDTYPSYESALSAGIAAALELIEKKGE